jgi:hypothetical protein
MTVPLLHNGEEWLDCAGEYHQQFNQPTYRTNIEVEGTGEEYRRRARDWTVGVQFPAGRRDFSLLHSVQTGSGAHPASYPLDVPRALSSGVKRPVRKGDRLPPSSAHVKNGGAIPPLPHTFSWRGA